MDIKNEAEYFGDIIVVPYMDHYDLVVLKTIAICEHGVRDRRGKMVLICVRVCALIFRPLFLSC